MSVVPVPGLSLGGTSSLPGTLGFFARFENAPNAYAITCSHNLTPNWTTVVDKPSSSLQDQDAVRIPSSSFSGEDVVGQIVWAAVLAPQGVEYDCALVRMSKTVLQEVGGKPIHDVWLDDNLPEALVLVSGETRLEGVLVDQREMAGPLTVPRRTDGPFEYNHLFEVRYDQATMPGMSGAPVLASTGQLVGMHVGALDERSFFQRASEILKRLGMTLFRM